MLPDNVKTEIIKAMLEKKKTFKKVYDILNDQFMQHGFMAHAHSPVFKGNLMSEIEAYLDAL